MGTIHFLSGNILLTLLLIISILSGINIFQNFNDIIFSSEFNSSNRQRLFSYANMLYLLILFTLGDIELISKAQSRYKKLKQRKLSLKKVKIEFIAIVICILVHFAIIFLITENFLDDIRKFQFMTILLMSFNVFSLLLLQRYFWHTLKTPKKNKVKTIKKLCLTTITWTTLNTLFIISSLIMINYSDVIELNTGIAIESLWLISLGIRSILDMLFCRKFYSKIIIKAINNNIIKIDSLGV